MHEAGEDNGEKGCGITMYYEWQDVSVGHPGKQRREEWKGNPGGEGGKERSREGRGGEGRGYCVAEASSPGGMGLLGNGERGTGN
jgi:hypothetical protein